MNTEHVCRHWMMSCNKTLFAIDATLMMFGLMLFFCGIADAQDLYLSCAIHPSSKDNYRRWTCGVHNSGTQERVVTEADVVMALQALGVNAIEADYVRQRLQRRRYKGVLYTTARILEGANGVGVIGTALDVIKPGATGAALMGLGAVVLPMVPPALRARDVTDEELEAMRLREPLGVKPGSGVLLGAWSGPHAGAAIVCGYLSELLAPLRRIRETEGRGATMEPALRGVAMVGRGKPVQMIGSQSGPPPIPLRHPPIRNVRCSHVAVCVRASYDGAFERGWWR